MILEIILSKETITTIVAVSVFIILMLLMFRNADIAGTEKFWNFCLRENPSPNCGQKMVLIRLSELQKQQFVFGRYLRNVINLGDFAFFATLVESISEIRQPLKKEFAEHVFKQILATSPENTLALIYAQAVLSPLRRAHDMALETLINIALEMTPCKRERFYHELTTQVSNIGLEHANLKPNLTTMLTETRRKLKM